MFLEVIFLYPMLKRTDDGQEVVRHEDEDL